MLPGGRACPAVVSSFAKATEDTLEEEEPVADPPSCSSPLDRGLSVVGDDGVSVLGVFIPGGVGDDGVSVPDDPVRSRRSWRFYSRRCRR